MGGTPMPRLPAVAGGTGVSPVSLQKTEARPVRRGDSPDKISDPNALRAMVLSHSEVEIELESSGTSGPAKMVTQTLANLMRAVVVSPRHGNDVWGLAFNPTHIAGVQVYLQAFANGNTTVNLWGLDPVEAGRRCVEWGVTHLSATPTFFRMLQLSGMLLIGVQSVTLGGEASDGKLVERLRPIFPNARIHNVFATTETGTLLITDGVVFCVPPSMGDLLRVDAGTLRVHQSLLGRFGMTSEWYDTGDLVEILGSNPLRFRFVGRDHDIINVGGEKVRPAEVQSVLESHPAVGAARVFGKRNSVTGQLLCADVVWRGQVASEPELREHLRRHLPAYKIPRIIRAVERIEMTRTGKAKRG
jgi:acyl-coenzyme A synthetase/AMP-(fatty) acid ligase